MLLMLLSVVPLSIASGSGGTFHVQAEYNRPLAHEAGAAAPYTPATGEFVAELVTLSDVPGTAPTLVAGTTVSMVSVPGSNSLYAKITIAGAQVSGSTTTYYAVRIRPTAAIGNVPLDNIQARIVPDFVRIT